MKEIIKTSTEMHFQNLYPNLVGQLENPENRFRSVKTITFVVTENCTLQCTYCYEWHKNNKKRMTFETAKKCIDLIFEDDLGEKKFFGEEKAYALIFDFIGGEPLLEIKLIDKIMEYFLTKAANLNHRWQTEYMISMISNGTQYFTKPVQDFINKYQGRLSLGISIDGNRELHDACRVFPDGSPSFDYAETAFKDLLSRHMTTSTKMTISPDNLIYLSQALKDLSSYERIEEIPGNAIYEHEWTIEEATEFYKQLKDFGQYSLDTKTYSKVSVTLFTRYKLGSPLEENENSNYCGGTGKMLAFTTEGVVYPCLRYTPFTLQNQKEREDMVLGDCNNGFLINEEQINRYSCLECITRYSQSTDKCFNCPIAAGCSWCSGWNYDYYGTPNKRFTGICNMHKARVLANIWYWNMLYRKENMPDRFPIYIPEEWALEIISKEEWELLKELAKKN